MTFRPLIGINCDYRPEAHTTPAFGYHRRQVITRPSRRAGGVPVVVPPQADEAAVARIVDVVDGFVMIGGADLDPRNDGFMRPRHDPTPRTGSGEASDRLLMAEIAERRCPVLAIGTGMQLLNVDQGGNLVPAPPRRLAQSGSAL